MSKMKLKLMLAGVVVACAFGGIALKFAWATPGDKVSRVRSSGPALMDEIDVKGDSDTDKIEIKTKGLWESSVFHYVIKPGGHTGWHSHPGAVFVLITKGAMTKYEGDDPLTPADYPAGTGFVEGVGHVHIARNESETIDLEFDALFLIPAGGPDRIDEDPPF